MSNLTLLTAVLATLSGLVGRIVSSSNLDRDHLEGLAVGILAADGTEEDLAAALETLLEDAIDWQTLAPGPAGVLLEQAEDPLLRAASRRLAAQIARAWRRLDHPQQRDLLAEHISRRARTTNAA